MMKAKVKKYLLLSGAGVMFFLLVLIEIFKDSFVEYEYHGELIYSLASRFVGGFACLLFLIEFSSGKMLAPKFKLKPFLLFLPCMLIAVNNFPFVPYLVGEAYVNSSVGHIILYAAVCLGVGFFEELAFRGCIFSAILQRRGKRPVDVFWSIVIASAVFGVIHIVNLFAGASPASVILQVGYSFLIGGMCSVILIKTSNIWYCVIFHSVYNFAGGVVPECGGGSIWTLPEIILTAAVSVVVAVYVIALLVKIKPYEIDALLNEQDSTEQK